MILEKAMIKYDKKGRYEYTIQNEYMEFESEEKAVEYIEKNIEVNIEYYFYNTEEEVDTDNAYKVIICNDRINKMKKQNELDDRIEQLEKEIKYEKRKLNVCAYGKSDLMYIDELEEELEELYEERDEL